MPNYWAGLLFDCNASAMTLWPFENCWAQILPFSSKNFGPIVFSIERVKAISASLKAARCNAILSRTISPSVNSICILFNCCKLLLFVGFFVDLRSLSWATVLIIGLAQSGLPYLQMSQGRSNQPLSSPEY